MTPSLERLAEMVRQAEARTRAQKLGTETQQAAEALRTAEARSREAEQRLREDRPALQRALDQIDRDEVQLKELTKKISLLMGTAALGTEERRAFEREIEASKAEIDAKRKDHLAKLEAVTRGAAEARRALNAAMTSYQALRREMDRILPHLAGEFSAEDRLVRDAEVIVPAGQIRALAREIEDASPHFGMLDRQEQLAQLTIWIGRYRRLQAMDLVGESEDDLAILKGIFPRLVGISKQYEPGYIEAFRQGYTTDWDAYVADAEDRLRETTELARRNKDQERTRREHQVRDLERQRVQREQAVVALAELKALILQHNLPEEGVDEFLTTLARVVNLGGIADPDLIETVMPYRDLLNGADFRALRKQVDKVRQDESKDEETYREQVADLLALTRGRKALMIGGAVREESRRALEHVFEFGELEWASYEGSRPALLDSLEQRVRNRGVDLVLILKSFIGHHVPERLRPLCEQNDIPCLMVEHGYGPAQVAEILRKGLLKPAPAEPGESVG